MYSRNRAHIAEEMRLGNNVILKFEGGKIMLSVIVVLLCIDCAISVCNMSTLISYREVLAMLIELLTEEEEGE